MSNKKRKNTVLATVAIGVVALAIIVVNTRKSGTISADFKCFAVEDTASITKIFLANSFGNKTLLERTDNGWLLNQKYAPVMNNIQDLLNCIQNIKVKDLVAKAARENVNKRMAVGAVKVEIHYTDYRIKIAKLKLLKHTKIKIYYIGQPTQDNMSNYAIMEGMKVPCVVYLPGFRGFVSPKYSPIENDWRSHLIVDLRLADIQEVTLTDFENSDNSLRILRSGNRSFDIIHVATNQRLEPYDTFKLLDHLSEYRNLNYESLLSDLKKKKKDSIFDRKFKELTILDTKGNKTCITMYLLKAEGETDEDEHEIDFMNAYNRDRFYAVINGNKEEVVLCQYFVFDRIVQPFEYYTIGNTLIATPKKLR
jgi:hypothetical protein